ncbi:MAG: peptidoglycan glycosyltransferase, partial [Coraliomargarita sp.]
MSEFDIHRRENPRIILLLWISLAAALVLVLGLAWRQLIAKETFDQIEKRQIERRILKPGPRGNIYDREGRLLVGNRPHYSAVVYLDDLRPEFRKEYSRVLNTERKRIAAAHPDSIDKPKPDHATLQWDARMNVLQRYIDQINAITGRDDRLSRTKLKRHFNEQLLLPLPLAQDLDPEQYARLAEQIPPPPRSPIRIHTDTARYYPNGPLAAHAIGYVQSTDPDATEIPDDGIKTFTFKKKVGKTGIERSFNQHLSGTTGMEIWRVDPLGFQDTRLQVVPPKQGDNLITSIDIDLQRAAQTALGERIGAAVALDVQTGEVLAIASHPGYDLNRLSPFIPRETFD